MSRSVQGGDTIYFEYGVCNSLDAICSTDPVATTNYFEYDALGQRTQKVDFTGTHKYVWNGLNVVLSLDMNNELQRAYVHGHTPIEGVSSLLMAKDRSEAHHFYHLDQVAGVMALTDTSQTVVRSQEYSPFGRVLNGTGSVPSDFSFPGTYVDLADRGYLRLSPARLYDATTGRFSARDPMGYQAAWLGSLYVYGADSPGQNVDPSGKMLGEGKYRDCRKVGFMRTAVKPYHLFGGKPPSAEENKFLHDVFQQCCICIRVRPMDPPWSAARTRDALGDFELSMSPRSEGLDRLDPEVKKLTAHQASPVSFVYEYFVQSIGRRIMPGTLFKLKGVASKTIRETRSAPYPALAVASSAGKTTRAHELAHVFGLRHRHARTEQDLIFFTDGRGVLLSEDHCDLMRKSSLMTEFRPNGSQGNECCDSATPTPGGVP